MKKTKKSIFGLLLLMLICLVAACFCACAIGANGQDGINGKDGVNGKSAYEIWLDEGHNGSQSDFLKWLKGSDGSGSAGENGQDGTDGKDGKSAYQIWLDNGHTGTEAEFLDWLKGSDGSNGVNGKSAYEIFMQQYPYYKGTKEQWLIALVNGQLRLHEVTFKSEVADDIVKYVVGGYTLTDVPEVPEKEGQTSAIWNVTDFSTVTEDLQVTAVYDMRKYVTFHNEFTEDEDIVKIVNYNEALTDIPTITAKDYNNSKWSVTDFSCIKTDLQVEAVYETQGLRFTAINQQTEYRVSRGNMNPETEELFIPAEHNGKPVTVIEEQAFWTNLGDEEPLNLKLVYIPNGITEIREMAFYDCTELTSIYIPNSIKLIAGSAFSDCYNIRKLNIDMSIIPDISIFSSLTELTLGANVREIENSTTYYLNSILCGYNGYIDNISVSKENKYFKFEGNCLIDIENKILIRGTINSVIPTDGSVTSIGERAFQSCYELEKIAIPESVTYIGYEAFSGCSMATEIILPKGLESIGDSAFSGCLSVTNITIPENITSIGERAFSSCGFINLVVPNNITSIDFFAFASCENLISITLPKSIISLNSGFVYSCNKLEYLYYGGSKADFDKIDIIEKQFWDEYFPETAVICYYSETKPTGDGFYWYYDIDGVTPIVWENDN